MASKEVEILDFWTCLFLDSPKESFIIPNDINNENAISNSSRNGSNFIYYECRAYGKYLSGINSNSIFNGHYVCVFIFSMMCIVGVFGIISNMICTVVLQKSHKGSSLKDLLTILAILEMALCCSAMGFAYLIVSILENLNRGEVVYLLFRLANIMFSLCRTGAIYVTVLATIERYIVVSFPMKSKVWLTPGKSRFYIGLTLLLTFGLNTPLIFNSAVSTVDENDVFPPYTHVENFPYVFKDTHFTNRDVHDMLVVLNYVAPFPFLLLFNGLLYKAIYDWGKTRFRLNGSHRHEIKVAKMFSITVLVLAICHAMSCVVFYTFRYKRLIYRELILVQLFCFLVGASVNFFVYYSLGRNFQREFNNVVSSVKYKCHKVCVRKIPT